jgi:hypothetical protein
MEKPQSQVFFADYLIFSLLARLVMIGQIKHAGREKIIFLQVHYPVESPFVILGICFVRSISSKKSSKMSVLI